MARAAEEYLRGYISLGNPTMTAGVTKKELLDTTVPEALAAVDEVTRRWQTVLALLDTPWQDARKKLIACGIPADDAVFENYRQKTVFDAVYDRVLRISWKKELRSRLFHIFAGDAFEKIRTQVDAIHAKVLRGRVFIALHMHAGDGNVHTNVPLNSDNYRMMQLGQKAVHLVMKTAKALGGSITGEHGVGLTKIEFLPPEDLIPFYEYLDKVDPQRRFNAGKLKLGLENAYTPSFNLLTAESLIMQQTELKAISDAVKNCLRCGKCKSQCTTHVPRAGLLYSPRNKIIAVSLLTEAFLYESQTRRGVNFEHLLSFSDIADHCTVCLKCQRPCPVKINFGEVTMLLRNFLSRMHCTSKNPLKKMGMQFLALSNPRAVELARRGMVDMGLKMERKAADLMKKVAAPTLARPSNTTGQPALKETVITLV